MGAVRHFYGMYINYWFWLPRNVRLSKTVLKPVLYFIVQ